MNNYDYQPYDEDYYREKDEPRVSSSTCKHPSIIKKMATVITYDEVLDFHLMFKKIHGIKRGEINFFDRFKK